MSAENVVLLTLLAVNTGQLGLLMYRQGELVEKVRALAKRVCNIEKELTDGKKANS